MYKILMGDVLEKLQEIPGESVQCVVTSPPYWGLRDYQTPPQVWPDSKPLCEVHEWGKPQTGRVMGGGNRSPDNKWPGIERSGDKGELRFSCVKCGAWLGSLGLEPTPELYIEHMVQIFREVRRTLRKNGVLWVNIGDSYSGNMSRASNGGRAEYGKKREGV